MTKDKLADLESIQEKAKYLFKLFRESQFPKFMEFMKSSEASKPFREHLKSLIGQSPTSLPDFPEVIDILKNLYEKRVMQMHAIPSEFALANCLGVKPTEIDLNN